MALREMSNYLSKKLPHTLILMKTGDNLAEDPGIYLEDIVNWVLRGWFVTLSASFQGIRQSVHKGSVQLMLPCMSTLKSICNEGNHI